MAETPNIHLSHGADADTNRNWDILDTAIRALGLRQIIPNDVLVQGTLEVTGNTTLDGSLAVSGQSTLGVLNVSNTATFLSAVALDGPVIIPNGPLTLPPGSIPPAALAPGSAVHGVWVGTAIGTALSLGGTSAKLAEVLTDATEDPARWSLVIAQLTLTIEFGAAGAAPVADVLLDLHRGGVTVQSRELFYDASTLGSLDGMDLDIPVTVVRLSKPGDTSNAWSLWGSASLQGGAQVLRSFCQLHTIQFT